MTAKIKVAVIGCGFFAQNHLHGWAELGAEGAELVAVCDADAAKADAAGKRFGVPAFTSHEAMLDATEIDLADVVTRMDTHRAICASLAERKIAAIVQKPLAPRWDDCVAIADTAAHHGSFLAVHENFRFQSPMMRVKELLGGGAVGEISWARLAFRTGFDVFSNQPYLYAEERLVILDVGIHVLDLARVFLGEAVSVSCETQKRNPNVRADDTATMLLRHASGAVSVAECTYMAKRHPDLFPHTRLEIEGTKGALILNSDDEIILSDGASHRRIAVDNPLSDWMEKPWHVVQRSVLETSRHILRAVQSGRRASTDIADNLKTFALVEAAYLAAHSRRAEAPRHWTPKSRA
jgi:predicted dehydrogenase